MRILLLVRTNDCLVPKKDYIKYLIDKFIETGWHVDIYDPFTHTLMDFNEGTCVKIADIPGIFSKFLPLMLVYNIFALRRFLGRISKPYDICHMLNIRYEYLFTINAITSKCRKTIATHYGGDFYLNPVKKLFPLIYNKVDLITCSNDTVTEDVGKYFGITDSSKLQTLYFPWVSLFAIDKLRAEQTKKEAKESFGLPTDRIAVTCGTNANSNEQHGQLLAALKKSDLDRNKITFIFPITYDAPLEKRRALREMIRRELSAFDVRIFFDYMSMADNVRLKYASDIMVNVRKTDQANAAMIEAFYTGNLIINGDWLPYYSFRKVGLHDYAIGSIDQVPATLKACIEKINNAATFEVKKNIDIISKNYHPESIIKKSWLDLYKNITTEDS